MTEKNASSMKLRGLKWKDEKKLMARLGERQQTRTRDAVAIEHARRSRQPRQTGAN